MQPVADALAATLSTCVSELENADGALDETAAFAMLKLFIVPGPCGACGPLDPVAPSSRPIDPEVDALFEYELGRSWARRCGIRPLTAADAEAIGMKTVRQDVVSNPELPPVKYKPLDEHRQPARQFLDGEPDDADTAPAAPALTVPGARRRMQRQQRKRCQRQCSGGKTLLPAIARPMWQQRRGVSGVQQLALLAAMMRQRSGGGAAGGAAQVWPHRSCSSACG